MSIRATVALVALLSAVVAVQAQSQDDRTPPASAAPLPPLPNDAQLPPSAVDTGAPSATAPADADKARPATDAAEPSEKTEAKPQKEAGWYAGGIYSFNLLNIEYYDLDTKDLHFSGQRRDIGSDWAGLADLLTRSKAMGFVEINRKFVNLRNLSAIHDLGSRRGATLTFRDGATLKITDQELHRLIEVTK